MTGAVAGVKVCLVRISLETYALHMFAATGTRWLGAGRAALRTRRRFRRTGERVPAGNALTCSGSPMIATQVMPRSKPQAGKHKSEDSVPQKGAPPAVSPTHDGIDEDQEENPDGQQDPGIDG